MEERPSKGFEKLDKKIQKWIWDKGWEHLRDIQEEAIDPILSANQNVIISSTTASGKTEAAYLPIFSYLLKNHRDGIRVLYISPLKALIDDQFLRLNEIGECCQIPVHRWHGDVSSSKKRKVVKDPEGILLITTESLESLFIGMLVNFFARKSLHQIFKLTTNKCKILDVYSKMIQEIEQQKFDITELKSLQQVLLRKDRCASVYLRRLSFILGCLDLRLSGSLYFLINNLFLWDFHCIFKIEKWVLKVGKESHKWFEVLGRIEALSCFANMYFNHPDWIMPELTNDVFILKGTSIGHPLILKSERVNNDIEMTDKGSVLIVTGPNMAGKSTYLRTIGINLVLAFAGAPVCAKVFCTSILKLYSNMKIIDSLDKKLSLFYNELQHLKRILNGIQRKEPIFFLIDEMLKGTNTKDRQQGAFALIRQLIRQGANGIVATHDLELANLEKEFPNHILNYHFDGYVQGDKLLFDYRLKSGVCESFNAITLMRRIGIEV